MYDHQSTWKYCQTDIIRKKVLGNENPTLKSRNRRSDDVTNSSGTEGEG
ncbi:MAG TPA: hypothetical protein VGO47_04235 [Chlamydiales bacterium]|nr:hypothetical protein [Chlamydiales bacterium]